MPETEILIQVIKDAIKRRGISQAELSRRIGISERSFWNRLHGISKFTAAELIRIGKALDISLDDLSEKYFDNLEKTENASAFEEADDA